MKAEAGKRDDMVAVFESFIDETVVSEEGTESYTLLLDEGDADVMWVHEVYTNRAALDAHMTSPGFIAMLGQLAGIATADTQLNTMTPVAGKGFAL